jgi:hypothetical protein
MLSPQRPAAPATALAAVGALPVLCALMPALRAGGLAPVFCAAVLGGFLGAPLAGAEWRRDEPDATRDALAETTIAAWTAAAVASLAAPWRADTAPAGAAWFAAATALGALFAGRVLARHRWGRAVAVGAVAVAASVALWPATGLDATGALAPAPPWTLLEPRFEAWRDWLAGAAAAGVLAAGAGAGPLSLFRREPGAWQAPWAALGVALSVAVAGSVRAGSDFAAELGAPGPDAAWLALGSAALLLTGPAALRRPLLTAVSAAWLCGPAAGALPFVITVLAPGLSAALLMRSAWSAGGAARGAGALGSAALAGAVLVSGRWPDEPSAAAAIGVLVVGVFWWAATRLALAPREAA